MNKQLKKINLNLDNIQRKVDFDLLNRSLLGMLIYPLFWPIIIFSNDFYIKHSLISWGIMSALIGVSFFRLTHYFFSRTLYVLSRKGWFVSFVTLTFLQSIIWGYILFVSIISNDFLSIRSMILLVIGGISSASLHALIPKFWVALVSTCLMLVPSMISLVCLNQDHSITLLIFIYCFYLLITGKKLNQDYTMNHKIKRELELTKKDLEKESQIDSLTGIYNRGHFDDYFYFQWHAAMRNRAYLSLLMIDIDFLKNLMMSMVI